MRMINKYLKIYIYIYFQKKDRKLLGNTPNQPTKCRTKNWVVINNDARGLYNKNSQIKFTTSMLKSSLCDCSDPYILASRTIKVASQEGDNLNNNNNKEVVFKNCALLTDCII